DFSSLCNGMSLDHAGKETISRIDTWKPVAGSFGQRAEHLDHDGFILFFFEGAGGVNKQATGCQAVQGISEDLYLPQVQVTRVCRLQPPLDLWIAGEGSCARARSVDQNTIEAASKRKRTGGVQGNQGAP